MGEIVSMPGEEPYTGVATPYLRAALSPAELETVLEVCRPPRPPAKPVTQRELVRMIRLIETAGRVDA